MLRPSRALFRSLAVMLGAGLVSFAHAGTATYSFRVPVPSLTVQSSSSSTSTPSSTASSPSPAPAAQYALQFNGANADGLGVALPSSVAFNGFTVYMKVYSNGVYADLGQQSLFTRTGEFEASQFSDGTVQFALDCNWAWVPTGVVLPSNQWSTLAMSYNSSTGAMDIALNGTVAYSGTVCAGLSTPPAAFEVGGRSDATTPWTGKMHDFALWTNALSSAQIQVLTSQTAAPTDISTGLVANLPMSAGSGTTITDQSGTGSTGSLLGTVGWTTY